MNRRTARSPGNAGFTLLELIIAVAILGVALVAIHAINGGAVSMHAYSKRLTIATMLARSKMADIESKLQAEGLPADDETEEGDFDEEGFPRYKWKAEIIRPKTEDINTDSLLSMFGMGGDG
ncbi:MAG: prepilin-type N-terminal cleavage/methylation domain-containing protein, partial [Myxococcales bacterium]